MATDLENNFKPARGDLIYGFETPRASVIAGSKRLKALKDAGLWITCNDFNNNTILQVSYLFTPNTNVADEDAYEWLASNTSGKPTTAQAQNFAANLLMDKRLGPQTVRSMSDGALLGTGDTRTFKMIRKSCKFGLKYVTTILDQSAVIHFLLDDFVPEPDVLSKKKFDGRVPITVSELRWVFRNWPSISSRVLFYRDSRQCRAPWNDHPDEWRKYAEARLEKYRELGKAKNLTDEMLTADIADMPTNVLLHGTNRLRKVVGEAPGVDEVFDVTRGGYVHI